jgi:hypothetical protein
VRLEDLQLADIVANDPGIEIIDDQRAELGSVMVKCPHDDGSDDHALLFCNPWNGMPARAYCLSPACSKLTTLDFMARMDALVAKVHKH